MHKMTDWSHLFWRY